MSGTLTRTVLLGSPREATQAFAHYPKQKQNFLVRFNFNGKNVIKPDSLTYVAKMVDRPKVTIKTEEMHQYNKRRQVYTGFKLEPVRMQLYDTAGDSLMSMWQDYTRYYFGDFNAGTKTSYMYDAIGANWNDSTGKGFGFTAANTTAHTGPSAPNDMNAQFYFDTIEIYHFYRDLYDCFQLVHPRITGFEPDDLDYETSGPSMISLTLAYENLQYSLQQSFITNSNGFDEFTSGAFNGHTPYVPSTAGDVLPGSRSDNSSGFDQTQGALNLFQQIGQGLDTGLAAYRYNGSGSTGPLTTFGDFQFGQAGGTSLGSAATPQVASTLEVGRGSNGLTAGNAATGVVNGASYDVAYGQANAVSSSYAPTQELALSMLGSSAIQQSQGGSSLLRVAQQAPTVQPMQSAPTADNLVLSPSAYGVINARSSGTSQYGWNKAGATSDDHDF